MSLAMRLDNMRRLPLKVRKQYAFFSSLIITLVIGGVWLLSFGPMGVSSKAAVSRAVNSAGTPAQTLVASVGSFFGGIRDMIVHPKTVIYSTVEVSPGKK